MRLERCLFPFAPSKKKLSSMTILLHLIVYAALIWALIKAQELSKENFESPPAAINVSHGGFIAMMVITGIIVLAVIIFYAWAFYTGASI